MCKTILAIGSANTEDIIPIDRLARGGKSECKEARECFGGSAVNWAVRLQRTLVEKRVFAACPCGPDEGGTRLRNHLEKLGIKPLPGLPPREPRETSHSWILVSGDTRTVISKRPSGIDAWATNLSSTISDAIEEDEHELIAMIGHIPCAEDEHMDIVKVTADVLDAIPENCTYVYANFGRAQYSICYHRWKDLFPQIHCFQLNITEARSFLRHTSECGECRKEAAVSKLPKNVCLRDILRFFSEIKMTAVITLAGSGSVAVLKESETTQVIFTWPRIPSTCLDPTGSGDAFGAGVIWYVASFGVPKSSEYYMKAFSAGSYFGACACQDYGGCTAVPEHTELLKMIHEMPNAENPSICRPIESAEGLLYMLDSKHQPID